MKRLLFLTAILSTLLIGCSKDEENKLGNFDYPHALLVGRWQLTQVNGSEWIGERTEAYFWGDGRYEGTGYFGDGKGTYRFSGKEVICYIGKEEYVRYGVLSINSTEASLTMTMDGSSITIQCKKLTDNPDEPIKIEVPDFKHKLLEAFDYTDELTLYNASEFMYDGKSMILYYGLRYSKIWLGIADNVGDKYVSYYEWTGGEDVEESITVNLPYVGQKTGYFSRITAIYGIKNASSKFAFAVNIYYDGCGGISKLLLNSGNTTTSYDLEQDRLFKIREWTDDCFVTYYDDMSAGAGWCYSFDGEEQYEFASYWNFSNNLKYYALISAEEGITIHHDPSRDNSPSCSRQNFKTGASGWSWPSYPIIFPDVAADARYDSWSLNSRVGSVWTFSANITLYSGEKINRKFTVNIDTGEISDI